MTEPPAGGGGRPAPAPGTFHCPPGTHLELILEVGGDEDVEVVVHARSRRDPGTVPAASRPSWRQRFEQQRPVLNLRHNPAALPWLLFLVGVGLFLFSRFHRLADFPIAFNSDEVVAVVRAVDLVRDGFFDYEGRFLPTYFDNDNKYSLGATVYAQVIPYLLFGKSIWAARGAAILITLLGVIWMTLMLRDIYRMPYWWLSAFALTATPTWFLFTRTAFETAQMTAFFAGFLYFYLLYRKKDRRHLHISLVLAALAFYSYLPAQLLVVLTGAALLVLDWRYHWQDRRRLAWAVGLVLLLALPWLRFEMSQPGRYIGAMERYSSYWASDMAPAQKVLTYLANYLRGLSPFHLYWPHDQDETPFLMKGYGHMGWWNIPFLVAGVVAYIRARAWRTPEGRTILVVLVAAPVAGALLETKITRELVIILPLLILTTMGYSLALEALERRAVPRPVLSISSAAVFTAVTLFMMFDAVVQGPTWYRDYGLGGLQYGANQVFPQALAFSEENPETPVFISDGWCWSADTVSQFYLPPESKVFLATPDELPEVIAAGEDAVFVVIPGEYDKLVESGEYAEINVEKVIPYPDGTPGFRFVRLAMTPDRLQALERGYEQAKEPVTVALEHEGERWTVTHPPVGGASIESLFDGDLDTHVRSDGQNPFVLDIQFGKPRRLSGFILRLGSERNRIKAVVFPADGSDPLIQEVEAGPVEAYKDVEVTLDDRQLAQRLLIEILDVAALRDARVHVWELELLD